MIDLPQRDGTMYRVTDLELSGLRQDYPRIDVEHELRKFRRWLEANPRRRKVNTHRAIINWLNGAKPNNEPHNPALWAPEPEELPGYSAKPETVSESLEKARRALGMRR